MVITFHTATEAMAMDKFCNQKDIPGRLIPVPTEISSGCGPAWRVKLEEYPIFQGKIEESDLKFEQAVELML